MSVANSLVIPVYGSSGTIERLVEAVRGIEALVEGARLASRQLWG